MDRNRIQRSSVPLGLLCAVMAIAIFLRFSQLNEQIITGDEWHALHIAMEAGYGEIATTFGGADHSIPVALYFRLLAQTTGLSQWLIQLPFVVAGSLLVFVIPWLLRRELGTRATVCMAGLLAISPVLITQARFARPYPIALLLAFIAIVSFYRWWQTRQTRDAVTYSVSAGFTSYLLILYAPLVLAPFVYFMARALQQARQNKGRSGAVMDVLALLKLGSLTTIVLACFLLPPLLNDFSSLSEKASAGALIWSNFLQVAPLFSGSGGWILTLALAAAALVGSWVAVRRRLEIAAYLVFVVLLHLLAVLIANPVGTENVVVIGRYLVPILPVFLFLVCLGLDWLISTLIASGKQLYGYAAIALVLLAAYMLGPLPKAYYAPNNNIVLMTISEIVLGDQLYEAMLSEPVAGFYLDMAEQPAGEHLIVQAPYYYNFDYFPVYQHLTKQRIAMGYTDGLCSSQRQGEVPAAQREQISLNNYYYLSEPESLRTAGVDYVVFHHDLVAELEIPIIVDEIDIDECIQAYREWFGDPVYADNKVIAFAVDSAN